MKAASPQPILTCRNLSVGYKNKAVLSGIDLAFESGQFISLLGPNGAGKTTLLRTLSRHLRPLAGDIRLNERPLSAYRAMELAGLMAVVLTDKVSPPLFSVFEFVALGRYPHTGLLGRLKPPDAAVVQSALRAVNALNIASRPFADLSDGERQKALVARALAQEPKILLLDEPTVHLDLKHRMEVMAILRDLCRRRNITVIASLHDVDMAAKVSDRVALIKGGALSAWGPPEAVLTGDAVAALYDFEGAAFDRHLGGIELRGDGRRGLAFVVAGMGSGAQVYRLLAKQGFSIVTGIVQTNDLDYYVARSLGAVCTSHSPLEALDDTVIARAARQMEVCDFVIDSGFDLGPVNQQNVALIRSALKGGKPVFSLRKNGFDPLPGISAEKGVIRCADTSQLSDALDHHCPVPPQHFSHLEVP
ncbi:MAG: ABC transporter ATP-binding protein [Pseudomonadota bacterium]